MPVRSAVHRVAHGLSPAFFIARSAPTESGSAPLRVGFSLTFRVDLVLMPLAPGAAPDEECTEVSPAALLRISPPPR